MNVLIPQHHLDSEFDGALTNKCNNNKKVKSIEYNMDIQQKEIYDNSCVIHNYI
ncbi:MAG: hypothetical protein N4A50_05135 [Vallitalea sp.]|jgi:hypothetical protein|nr:hypothetical protein [Vallitalea sp.]